MNERPPQWEPALIAVLLMAVMVVGAVIIFLVISVRCAIWFEPWCDREWQIRDWYNEIIVVLMAIYMQQQRKP